MRKLNLFFILFLFVVLLRPVEASSQPQNRIRFMFEPTPEQRLSCYAALDSFSAGYTDNVTLKVYKHGPWNLAAKAYFNSNTLYFYHAECIKGDLAHELAHIQQWRSGETLYEFQHHQGRFKAILTEVEANEHN